CKMSDNDVFARQLLEESKYALELAVTAVDEAKSASHVHSSLLLGFAALEAHINCIVDDFADRGELTVFDRSVLLERDIELKNGDFVLKDTLKIYRLED